MEMTNSANPFRQNPQQRNKHQKPVLKTSKVGPNWLSTLLNERDRWDLKRLKNRASEVYPLADQPPCTHRLFQKRIHLASLPGRHTSVIHIGCCCCLPLCLGKVKGCLSLCVSVLRDADRSINNRDTAATCESRVGWGLCAWLLASHHSPHPSLTFSRSQLVYCHPVQCRRSVSLKNYESTMLSKVHDVVCTVHDVVCTVHNVECTVHEIVCTVHAIECTVHELVQDICHKAGGWLALEALMTQGVKS